MVDDRLKLLLEMPLFKHCIEFIEQGLKLVYDMPQAESMDCVWKDMLNGYRHGRVLVC
jgi:hypothetical protein